MIFDAFIQVNSSVRGVADNDYLFFSIGSLDKNEFRRVTSPASGFMSYTECDLKDFNFEKNPLNNFDISTATSMIIMFRIGSKDVVDIMLLKKRY